MITDSTFYYFVKYQNGDIDSTFYNCNPDEIGKAMRKVDYGYNYTSLNWAAQKEHHEELLKVKTIQYDPNGKRNGWS